MTGLFKVERGEAGEREGERCGFVARLVCFRKRKKRQRSSLLCVFLSFSLIRVFVKRNSFERSRESPYLHRHAREREREREKAKERERGRRRIEVEVEVEREKREEAERFSRSTRSLPLTLFLLSSRIQNTQFEPPLSRARRKQNKQSSNPFRSLTVHDARRSGQGQRCCCC